MYRLMLIALLTVPLTACDKSDPGTTISIKADNGNVTGAMDGNSGEMKLDVPGFSGQIKLPKIQLDAQNFDLNGVHLYPGSTIESMNVAGGDTGGDGAVAVSFTSPASPVTVRQWFQERLNAAGYAVHPGGNGLVGTTEEHKPFALDLSADGSNRTKGRITLGS